MTDAGKKEPQIALFRASEYIDGMSLPAIEDPRDGKIYTGKLLSFNEVVPLQDHLEKLQGKSLDPQETIKMVTEICDKLGIPSEVVLSLPPKVMVKAVVHFFKSMFGESSSNGSSNKEPPTSTSV